MQQNIWLVMISALSGQVLFWQVKWVPNLQGSFFLTKAKWLCIFLNKNIINLTETKIWKKPSLSTHHFSWKVWESSINFMQPNINLVVLAKQNFSITWCALKIMTLLLYEHICKISGSFSTKSALHCITSKEVRGHHVTNHCSVYQQVA